MIANRPEVIIWNFTELCNFNCLHCYTRNRDVSEPEEKVLYDIAREIARSQPVHVSLGGGEPLLKETETFKCIEILKKTNCNISVSTNGSTIDLNLARKLKCAELDLLLVSLDSINPKTHNYLRNRPDAFDMALNAFQVAKKIDLPFGASIVVSKLNINEIENLINCCIELGSTYISIKEFMPVGNGLSRLNELKLDEEEARKTAKILNELQKKYIEAVTISIPAHLQLDNASYVCLCGRTHLTVLGNGDLKMCAFGTKIIGNALIDGIINVWRKSPYLVQNRINHVCEVKLQGEVHA